MNSNLPLPGIVQPAASLRQGPPWRAAAVRFASCAALGLMLTGCASAKMVAVHDTAQNPAPPPAIVYVADFELQQGSLQSKDPLASLMPLHDYFQKSKARSLVDLMSDEIVADITKKGIAAKRLPANAPLPAQGWLVRGTFTKIDEGNRMTRAVIGFGAGKTDLQVTTTTENLSAETPPASLYKAQTVATSNKLPGAAVTLNPIAAAAKFVVAGHDLDRSTKATAEKIAEQVVARTKAEGNEAEKLAQNVPPKTSQQE
jgi:hypothetical protein